MCRIAPGITAGHPKGFHCCRCQHSNLLSIWCQQRSGLCSARRHHQQLGHADHKVRQSDQANPGHFIRTRSVCRTGDPPDGSQSFTSNCRRMRKKSFYTLTPYRRVVCWGCTTFIVGVYLCSCSWECRAFLFWTRGRLVQQERQGFTAPSATRPGALSWETSSQASTACVSGAHLSTRLF